MKSRHLLKWIIYPLLFNAIFLCTLAHAESKTSESTIVEPTDAAMGNWVGELEMGASEQPFIMQVVAYDSGRYMARLLPDLKERHQPVAILKGLKDAEGMIHFKGGSDSGAYAGVKWQATYNGELIKGKISGVLEGRFSLSRARHVSPTLGATPPEGAVVLFDGNSLDGWRHPPSMTGFVNLAKLIGSENCVGYIRSEFWSEIAQKARLEMGSDDGIKAWLNGKEVHANNALRGAAPAQEKVKVSLNAGWNTLMLKVTQGGGGWGAFAKFVDKDGNALTSIGEKIPDSPKETGSRKYLDTNDNFLTLWNFSGPYTEAGKSPEALFDIAFAPETGEAKWQPISMHTVDYSPKWALVDNAMQVKGGSGSLMTNQTFKNFKVHVEFRSPFMPAHKGQARGNSGVYLQGRYEIQVLDSYGLHGKDNECGGIYKVAEPRVNMCAPPGQWQTYDITFHAAKFDAGGNKTVNAKLTVLHNGVPIHENLELPGPTGGAINYNEAEPGPLLFQDHGDLVRFRNVWLVELPE